MATESGPTDFASHERAYHRFLRVGRGGAIAAFIIAAVVVLIIAR